MKRPCLLVALSLFSAVAFSASPHMIQLKMHNASNALPAGMVNTIPALYVRYADSKYQMVVFNHALKAGEMISQSVYVPMNAQWVKPVIAYVDQSGAQHYWYCKEPVNLNELTQVAQPTRLDVTLGGLTLAAIKSDSTQTLPCTYQKVSIKQASE